MTQVIWAPQAVEDVEAIRASVTRDSPHYADLVVERIVAAVTRLESHPLSGRVVPEVGDESLREVVQSNYRSCTALDPTPSKESPFFMARDCSGWTEAMMSV